MGKRRFLLACLLTLGLCAPAGCSRQDTECLSSIGRKLRERASAATSNYRQKLDNLKPAKVPLDNLGERVRLRLRWEKLLADTSIEVVVSGHEVELKGMVKSQEERQRAIEIAEATVGVERVLVSLSLGDDK